MSDPDRSEPEDREGALEAADAAPESPREVAGPATSGTEAAPVDASAESSAPEAHGATEGQSPPAASSDEPALARPPLVRRIAGAVALLVGGFGAFCVMAQNQRTPWSVPVGGLLVLLACLGALAAAGFFERRRDEADAPPEVPAARLSAPLLEVAAATGALAGVLRLAVAGVLPWPRLTAGIGVTLAFLALVVAVFRLGVALGFVQTEGPDGRPLHRRHGFWLVAVTTLLHLPMLGSYSLSDPWETHYGEVAREMLARDDWISLWWAQDGWFWSKPILNFWAQGLFFSVLGVRWMPDQMLAAAANGRFPQPEWAARFPVFLLALLGAYFLYKGLAASFGRRPALLGGLVLITMPYWYLIAHQSMTDMPYVGPLTAGMGLFLLGVTLDPEARVPSRELRFGRHRFRVHAGQLLVLAVCVLVLPQVLYLFSRNLTLHVVGDLRGFRPHLDEFFLGSGEGNCGLPGNEACRWMKPTYGTVQPAYGGLGWLVLLGAFVLGMRGEERQQRIAFLAAWLFVALSAMAKGAPGLVLPVAVVASFPFVTRRWRELERFELPQLLLLVGLIVLPWYVAMYMRHGQPFTDRLLTHDMYKRAFVHVHDTNVGDDVSFRYYVWQLGYGLFPWTGLAAVGLLQWMRRRAATPDRETEVCAALFLWFLAAFGMFSITLTKFHHYILPAVPPLAALTGLALHRMLGDAPSFPRSRVAWAALGGGVLLTTYGVLRLRPGSLLGTTLDASTPDSFVTPPASPWLGGALVLVGAALLAVALRALRTPNERRSSDDELALGATAFGAVALTLLAGRDQFVTVKGDVPGQARLMQLFTYNYKRPWPDSLDFDGVLFAFTVVATGLVLLLSVARLRRGAALALVSLGVLWGAWGVNVYLVQASPHWGQRETLLEYYRRRGGPGEPLVAFAMNWKGENFYLGNRVPAFVSTGDKFKKWIEEQRAKGVLVMWFTTEHGRIGSLRSELGNPPRLDVVTSKRLNNKFFLARVELAPPPAAASPASAIAPESAASSAAAR